VPTACLYPEPDQPIPYSPLPLPEGSS
jgi:hypothetical protein